MTASESTQRTLGPFIPKETIDELHEAIHGSLKVAHETNEPVGLTADLVMVRCCDAIIKGWQVKQGTQREKSYNEESRIECDVRVSHITPQRAQIVAACQGPTHLLDSMKQKVIASVRRAVKKELKSAKG